MKHLLAIFFLSGLLFSCSDDVDIQGTYSHSSSILVHWESYIYDNNGDYTMISNDDVATPDISYYETTGYQKSITINGDGTAVIDDYGDIYDTTYEGNNPVKIDISGQPTDFSVINNGGAITSRFLSAGYVSSMCGDYVDCQDIYPSEWLFSGAPEGEIKYIIVVEETYIK